MPYPSGGVMFIRLGATLLAILLAIPTTSDGLGRASQSSLPVKGWNGAEWGMDPGQVAAATGIQLDKAERDFRPERDPTAKLYIVQGVPVGAWIAEARFIFGESGKQGLTSIVLGFGSQVSFERMTSELKVKYGSPTSEKKDGYGAKGLV